MNDIGDHINFQTDPKSTKLNLPAFLNLFAALTEVVGNQ